MKKIEVRTVNIAQKDGLFYVVVWNERVSKSRVFRTLVAAQSHAKRLFKKEGTVLNKESLSVD